MPEQEKKILDILGEAIPKMSAFDRGYLLGMAERLVREKEEKEETEENADDEKTG